MAGIVARATSCRRVAFLGCDAMIGGEASDQLQEQRLLAMAPCQPTSISLMQPDQTVGVSLLAMAASLAVRLLLVYISIPAVTAAIGFAFTASHLEKPQVTKGSCPFRPVPRLGSAYQWGKKIKIKIKIKSHSHRRFSR